MLPELGKAVHSGAAGLHCAAAPASPGAQNQPARQGMLQNKAMAVASFVVCLSSLQSEAEIQSQAQLERLEQSPWLATTHVLTAVLRVTEDQLTGFVHCDLAGELVSLMIDNMIDCLL